MAKSIVEECKRVRMSWLKKNGYLSGYRYGGIEWTNGEDDSKSSIGITVDTKELYIRFHYTQTDYWTEEKSDMDYRFNLIVTPCSYGGVRYWFICGLYKNGRYCGRRAIKLYKPPGGKWFGCRHCWGLSYYERQQSRGGKYGFLFKAVDIEDKAVKLQETMKRWYWGGKPTKKHRRLLRYCNQLEPYSQLIKKMKSHDFSGKK